MDNFKNINDTYGHQIGDMVLKEFSKVLKHSLRGNDLVFRIGGEEFAIIFLGLSKDIVENILNRIKENIKRKKFDILNKSITFSAGVAKLKEEDDFKSIFSRADKLLYEAKKSGKDKIFLEKE
nr:GGDEF domain-containing protein [Nitrosophilus kaiyonis]